MQDMCSGWLVLHKVIPMLHDPTNSSDLFKVVQGIGLLLV